jgi:hypothetical protein
MVCWGGVAWVCGTMINILTSDQKNITDTKFKHLSYAGSQIYAFK